MTKQAAVRTTSAAQMSREDVEAGIERLKPFLLRVDLPHGLRTDGTPRLETLMTHSWPALLQECGGSLKGLSVMDVACVNGGFSLEAAKAGAKDVWGFDVVPRYIEQARFLRDAAGIPNVRFDVLDLNNLSPEVHGTFDVTLCFGIMYHLENPVASMRKIAAATKKIMFLDTNIIPGKHPWFFLNTKAAYDPTADNQQEEGMAGMWRTETVAQMKPTRYAVEQLLKFLGFSTVKYVEPNPSAHRRYTENRTASFIAVR
jgi:2-polyprenyl-3-methyl-5-hydroxy-6-metoxy-1,4-benzoquinol methylase